MSASAAAPGEPEEEAVDKVVIGTAPRQRSDVGRLMRLLVVVVVVAVLYLARDLLIPVALAILLAFVLTPAVLRMQRLGAPRGVAVAVALGAAVALVVAVTSVVAIQAINFAGQLPEYRGTIREKLQRLEGEGSGWLARAQRGIDELEAEVRDATTADHDGTQPVVRDPLPSAAPPAVLVADERGPLRAAAEALAPFAEPLLAAVIVLVFAGFILVRREDLRDRLAALSGTERIRLTTQVFDDASRRISRYLVAQLAVNAAFGLAVGATLALLGVPNAILFGAVAVPLRFAPVIGSWLLAALPTLLAAIVFDGWAVPLAVLGIIVVMELVTAHIVEPLIFGAQTGLSTPAILLALLFWTWLWGAPGLVLAIPLTTCIAVLGRQVPQLRWLGVALDDAPALPPPMRFYQRVLALHADDALAIARSAVAASGFEAAAEELVGPALRLLERDRHGQLLSREESERPLAVLREVVEALAEDDPRPLPETAPRATVVPAGDEADAIMAAVVARALVLRGVRAEALGSTLLAGERADAALGGAPNALCVCAVPPLAAPHARRMIRRLRTAPTGHGPAPAIVAGLWLGAASAERDGRVETEFTEPVATTLEAIVLRVAAAANEATAQQPDGAVAATV